LLDTIEEVIRIKAVKYVLIDNLMTALDCDSNEALYRSQSNFIGSLAKLSKQYEVVIMIVAHPRKKAVGQTSFTSDDVSGSADITNRVDVVMSYDRVYDSKGEEIDPNQRKMTVTKNRLTGKLTSARNEILLYYNDDSKRVVGRDKNFSYRYVDKDKDGFASVSDIDLEQMNIPF
jgi:RecA-family ATPase